MRDWGVKFRYVPYKSGIDITKALAGGRDSPRRRRHPEQSGAHQGGKDQGLAVNTAKRMPMVAEVPTMDELKLKHTEPQIWNGLVGPAGLPPQCRARSTRTSRPCWRMPDVNDKLVKELGLEILPGIGPRTSSSRRSGGNAVVGPLVKELGLKVE